MSQEHPESTKPCNGKVVYATQAEALQAIGRVWRDPDRAFQMYRRNGKLPCRTYKCPYCGHGHWHLTSKPLVGTIAV